LEGRASNLRERFASVVVVKREVRKRVVVERSFMMLKWCWVGLIVQVIIALNDVVVGIGLRVVTVMSSGGIAVIDWLYALGLDYIVVVIYT
jgi:hypothetical protein